MTQVIAKVTLVKFMHAVNHARRRFPLVDANIHHESTLVLRVTDSFRRRYAATLTQVMSSKREREIRNGDEFYSKHCHLRLVLDTRPDNDSQHVVGGYCVLDGELMCFWNVTRGRGGWMLNHAIKDGAVFLDHFDHPHLNHLYESWGFTERLREPNDPKQRPTGGPDVIFRRREGN